jgi:hypothetical protein
MAKMTVKSKPRDRKPSVHNESKNERNCEANLPLNKKRANPKDAATQLAAGN